MKKIACARLVCATCVLAIFSGRAVLAVTSGGKINDQGVQFYGGGADNYYSQPSVSGTPITVLRNGFAIGIGSYYPHSFIGVNGGFIEDTAFYNIIKERMKTGTTDWSQNSLVIQMGGCYSGGFIDEFHKGGAQNLEIGTASWWGGGSTGVESPEHHEYYNTQTLPWINALNTGKNLLEAYVDATSDNPYSPRDLPQYFSTSDAMDAVKPGIKAGGGAAQPKYALVFVGSVKDKQLGDWQDSITQINSLLAKGYTANNIYFYYADYTAGKTNTQADAYQLPTGIAVRGPATEANFTAFFDTVKANAAGSQVIAEIGGHGGLDNEFKGLFQFAITRGEKGNLQFNFKVGGPALAAYSANPDGNALVRITPGSITGLQAGSMLDVVIKDPQGRMFDLGTITSDGDPNNSWMLDVPMAYLQAFQQDQFAVGNMDGDIQIEFANYSVIGHPDPSDTSTSPFPGDYSNVAISGFSIIFAANNAVVVPEPAALAFLLSIPLLVRRRRTYDIQSQPARAK